MNALIYVDPAAIRPVIDGVWHLTRLSAIPAPGEKVRMLCGAVAEAAFVSRSEQTSHSMLTQCVHCDVEYRSARGWPIRPTHPGLVARTPSGRQ